MIIEKKIRDEKKNWRRRAHTSISAVNSEKKKNPSKNTKWLNYSWNYKRGKINDITKSHIDERENVDGEREKMY